MGIFAICFRKHEYYTILNKDTLTYFHGVLLAVCALLSRFVAIFASFRELELATNQESKGTDSK